MKSEVNYGKYKEHCNTGCKWKNPDACCNQWYVRWPYRNSRSYSNCQSYGIDIQGNGESFIILGHFELDSTTLKKSCGQILIPFHQLHSSSRYRPAIDFPVSMHKAAIHFQENRWLCGIG